MDKLYYYFIKTKYLTFDSSDLDNLKKNHVKFRGMGLTIKTLSLQKRAAIEIGLLGKELSPDHRKVDNYILGDNFIVDSFIENESTLGASMKRLSGELLNI